MQRLGKKKKKYILFNAKIGIKEEEIYKIKILYNNFIPGILPHFSRF